MKSVRLGTILPKAAPSNDSGCTTSKLLMTSGKTDGGNMLQAGGYLILHGNDSNVLVLKKGENLIIIFAQKFLLIIGKSDNNDISYQVEQLF